MRRPLFFGIAALTIAAIGVLFTISRSVAPANADPTQGPTRAVLAAEPEAVLQFPGSTEFSVGGTDAVSSIESGSTPAITWRRLGVKASWDEIVSYFDSELRARGWRQGGCSAGLKSSEEHDVVAWHSDDRILRLGYRRDGPRDAVLVGKYYSVALIGEGVAPGCADSDSASAPPSP